MLKLILDDLSDKDQLELLNMLHEALVYIIVSNNGTYGSRDDYMMNFVRNYISTTKFKQIGNLNGYISDIIKQEFDAHTFKDNHVWLELEPNIVKPSNVQTSSY